MIDCCGFGILGNLSILAILFTVDYAICAIKAISISCHLAQSIRKQELFVAFLQNPPDARLQRHLIPQSFDWSIDAVVVENSIPRTSLAAWTARRNGIVLLLGI